MADEIAAGRELNLTAIAMLTAFANGDINQLSRAVEDARAEYTESALATALLACAQWLVADAAEARGITPHEEIQRLSAQIVGGE